MSEEKVTNNSAQTKKNPVEILLDEKRVLASLSYLGVLFLVPLLFANKKDSFISFHLRQGIVLFVADVIVSFIAWIPIVGWLFAMLMIVLSLAAFVQTLLGKKWQLPIIGSYAKKIKI
ncbi:hypothetical protein KKE28_03995 [Patescibacteria group bacterium]|nr:hypothetical protein [Patescibacteria group bacterium]MBU1915608.1 hypothetical protein [Patescibacteria group bacterium]